MSAITMTISSPELEELEVVVEATGNNMASCSGVIPAAVSTLTISTTFSTITGSELLLVTLISTSSSLVPRQKRFK